MNLIVSSGYKFINSISSEKATRVTHNSKTLIDHVFSYVVNRFSSTINMNLGNCYFSHHKFFLLSLNGLRRSNTNYSVTKYFVDFYSVQRIFESHGEDFEDFEVFHADLTRAVAKNKTITQVQVPRSSVYNKAWFSSHLCRLKNLKLKFYR
jgi:hypothetical protein